MYLLVFHCNIQFSLLEERKRALVVEHSYIPLFTWLLNNRIKSTIALTGYTVDYLIQFYPECIAVLRKLIHENLAEIAATPYAHSILANYPETDGVYSLKFTCDALKKHLNVVTKSGWNPECAWNNTVPDMFYDAGINNLMVDYDSYISSVKCRLPSLMTNSVEEVEKSFAIDPKDKLLHFPVKITDAVSGIPRSDRICNRMIAYLHRKRKKSDMKRWIRYYSHDDEGFTVIYSNDTEYIGTTAFFGLRELGPFQVFKPDSASFDRFCELITDIGEPFVTMSEAALSEKQEGFFIRDGLAWHNYDISLWKQSPPAEILDRKCTVVRNILSGIQKNRQHSEYEKAWFHLCCAESADSRTPVPPLSPLPESIEYARSHAEEALRIAILLKKAEY